MPGAEDIPLARLNLSVDLPCGHTMASSDMIGYGEISARRGMDKVTSEVSSMIANHSCGEFKETVVDRLI